MMVTLLAAVVIVRCKPMREITIEPLSAMDAVSSKEDYAIIFVQLDWAVPQRDRDMFKEFAKRYYNTSLRRRAKFHIINFTSSGYDKLYELPGWFEQPNAKIGGYGEIVWLKKGRVVGIAQCNTMTDVEEAMKLTTRYFP